MNPMTEIGYFVCVFVCTLCFSVHIDKIYLIFPKIFYVQKIFLYLWYIRRNETDDICTIFWTSCAEHLKQKNLWFSQIIFSRENSIFAIFSLTCHLGQTVDYTRCCSPLDRLCLIFKAENNIISLGCLSKSSF